jgi:hypothetical protein
MHHDSFSAHRKRTMKRTQGRPVPGSLPWAQHLADSGCRVEYFSLRWQTWFEVRPDGGQFEWLDMHGQPVRWRARPVYSPQEEHMRRVEEQAVESSALTTIRRLFGYRDRDTQ